MQKRIVILGDSPTKSTGFARVIRNLLLRWQAARAFDEFHVWGVGYWGNPHEFAGVKIWPAAQPGDQRWESRPNLTRFANLIQSLKPTHVFMLQDLWGLMPLCNAMRDFTKSGIRTALYFPVDAPLEPCWTRILSTVSLPVAYSGYGREQAAVALGRPEHPTPVGDPAEWEVIQNQRAETAGRVIDIPHGVDRVWCRMKDDDRRAARVEMFEGLVGESDFLMVNVAVNQRRKGLVQSLQTLACLKERWADGPRRARLYLHCAVENAAEGLHLGVIARQLGLVQGVDVFFGDAWHRHGQPVMTDAALNAVYNAADLFLCTSLGEGWGLPLTEAMACGLPVAGPLHTSVGEILDYGTRGLILPLGQADVATADNNRLRQRVSAQGAAMIIEDAVEQGVLPGLASRGQQWAQRPELNWDNIAFRWLDLLFK